MSFGQWVIAEMKEMFLQNLFIVVLLIMFTLFCVDYYNRFLKIVRKTDHIDLVERYVWLQMYRKYRKGDYNGK